jgi:hypothetical protein
MISFNGLSADEILALPNEDLERFAAYSDREPD